MNEAEPVFQLVLVANEQAAEILQAGKQPFDQRPLFAL